MIAAGWLGVCLSLTLCAGLLLGAEQQGQVRYGSQPVPGAVVTARQAGRAPLRTVTDLHGMYKFANLDNTTLVIRVEMQLFAPVEKEVDLSSFSDALQWELVLLQEQELAEVPRKQAAQAMASLPKVEVAPSDAAPKQTASAETLDDTYAGLQDRAADALLINGSVNNAAASSYAQTAAFGNNRKGRPALYNGSLGVSLSHSAFDARSYSLTGQKTPKSNYNRVKGLLSFAGPFRIPRLLTRNSPNFTVHYQWMRNTNVTTQAGVMPTQEERNGHLLSPLSAIDPATGAPFPGDLLPRSRMSPQATALLSLYPLPNSPGQRRYNYQVPLVSGIHQHDLQVRGSKLIRQKDFLLVSCAGQISRTDSTNLFGFLDTGSASGIQSSLQWRHVFSQRLYGTLEYRFTRRTDRTTPYFANRRNVSGEAGVTGNSQDEVNWGPSALVFSSGITTLSDAHSSLTRNQTSGISYGAYLNRGRHNWQFGGGYERQQFNVLSQQDPRGTFTFTGAAAGSDFAGFLLGIPDASSIAFGNADKYLRSNSSSVYFMDDWRQSPGFTVNLGLRWEYWPPVSEKYGRLVNLEIRPGFRTATPVVAGQSSNRSLLRPDRNGFAPRVAFSWRPMLGSSVVVRSGYGIYYDTSVYQPIALQMAQQAPLSKSVRVQNSPATPLSLANGFPAAAAAAPTFAVDLDFRVGYSQTWQMSVQRDLPGALQMVAGYTGTKGTRAQQAFLPNTVPPGSPPLCDCPTGFTYLTSNGSSIRHAGQLQLRRRLRSGFAAQLQYTFAKSLDNATLGGGAPGSILVAQNWMDLRAERGLSNFDQRHLLSVHAQYTSGMGLRGGMLMSGWTGQLLKDWTLASRVTAGSGLPLSPIILSLVPGTGVANSLRPEYTGEPLYDPAPGLFLNRAAFIVPPPRRWGNAGRNSITGPQQFTMIASVGRTFRFKNEISYDLRVDATNPLNQVTYPAWNVIVSSAQFGLPTVANPMRSLQVTLRMRF